MSTVENSKFWWFWLLGIVILAGVLRFAWLGAIPQGVTPDEVQQGYSAYSILKTGKDEWGDWLPIFPRSFGDYRPPLYVYLTVPSVAIFDLNMFAVRFPAALSGVLSVLGLYLLVLELFKSRKIALLSSLILTISAWHLFYSRVAWESNATLFFFIMGFWLFLRGTKQAKFEVKSLVLSAFCFGLTMFGYYSFQMFTPLFVVGLLGVKIWEMRDISGASLQEWVKRGRGMLSFVVVFGLFVTLLAYGIFFTGAGRRASDAAIYNQENLGQLRETQVNDPLPQPWGRVINNKLSYLGTQFAQNYLGYFSTTFLASPDRNDSSPYNLPGQWLLSVWEIFFALAGVIFIIKTRQPNWKYLLVWALVSPIPAALTRNYMHTQRVEVLLLLYPVLAAYGIYSVFETLRGRWGKLGLLGILGIFMLVSLVKRLDFYAFHQFDRPLGGVHYYYDGIFILTESRKDNYDKIIFTKSQGQPQIYLAFYSKMDPTYFQSQSQNWKDFEKEFKFLDQSNYSLNKYEFRNIEWNQDKIRPNSLIIGSEQETPDGVAAKAVFKDPFGKILFRIFDTNDEL